MPKFGTLTATILIVSETASRDPTTDKCIPVLENVFLEEDGQWEIAEKAIVTDNLLDIQQFILQRTDIFDSPNLILLSGGTGFAVKDLTPEVGASLSRCKGVLTAVVGCTSPFAQAGTWICVRPYPAYII